MGNKIFLTIFAFLLLSVMHCMGDADSDESKEKDKSGSDSRASQTSTLKFVAAVVRHGDRNPAFIYPNNEIQLDQWPQETLSWLTPDGAEHAYSVGRFIRHRYDGFLDRSYYNKEFKVWSSDLYRTVMTANVLGDSLYDRKFPWLHNSKYQPIPIMTVGKKDNDNLLHLSKPCHRRDVLHYYAFQGSDHAKAIEAKYANEFSEVKKETGMDNISLMFTAFKVIDNLLCQEAYGFPLPSWYQGSVKAALLDVNELTFKLFSEGDELKRLTGGPLLKKITETMTTITTLTDKDEHDKMHLYSGHDVSISALMIAMDIYDDIRPGFAASFYLELHEVTTGSYYVKLLYKRSYADDEIIITDRINGCSSDLCPFDTFMEAVKSGIPDDWDNECSVGSTKREAGVPDWFTWPL